MFNQFLYGGFGVSSIFLYVQPFLAIILCNHRVFWRVHSCMLMHWSACLSRDVIGQPTTCMYWQCAAMSMCHGSTHDEPTMHGSTLREHWQLIPVYVCCHGSTPDRPWFSPELVRDVMGSPMTRDGVGLWHQCVCHGLTPDTVCSRHRTYFLWQVNR